MILAKKTRQPTKGVDRYPSGKKKPDKSIAPTTFFRLREHGVRLGADPRLTTVLGQMGLFQELSTAEVDAGFRVAEIYGRFDKLTGAPRRHAASPSYQNGFGNGGLADDPRRIERLTRRAKRAYDDLQLKIPNERARALLEMVCCDNERPNPTNKPHLERLLRMLAEEWGMAEPKEKAAPKPKGEDVALMATAACDALEQWFSDHRSKATAFAIVPKQSWERERAIIATDSKGHHTVSVPLRGVPGSQLVAQLRLAAAVKGWVEYVNKEE